MYMQTPLLEIRIARLDLCENFKNKCIFKNQCEVQTVCRKKRGKTRN